MGNSNKDELVKKLEDGKRNINLNNSTDAYNIIKELEGEELPMDEEIPTLIDSLHDTSLSSKGKEDLMDNLVKDLLKEDLDELQKVKVEKHKKKKANKKHKKKIEKK